MYRHAHQQREGQRGWVVEEGTWLVEVKGSHLVSWSTVERTHITTSFIKISMFRYVPVNLLAHAEEHSGGHNEQGLDLHHDRHDT